MKLKRTYMWFDCLECNFLSNEINEIENLFEIWKYICTTCHSVYIAIR